ncbi:hypothetical protein [Thermovibrio sp.]
MSFLNWEKNKELLIFAAIVLIAFAIGLLGDFFRFKSFTKLWELFSVLDTASAVALAVLAFLAYREYSKGMDEIPIKLKVEEKELVDTKLKLLRKDISRSEIMGILGQVQNNPENRFNNSKLKERKTLLRFLEDIRKVQKGEINEIIIPISKEDFERHFSNLKPKNGKSGLHNFSQNRNAKTE